MKSRVCAKCSEGTPNAAEKVVDNRKKKKITQLFKIFTKMQNETDDESESENEVMDPIMSRIAQSMVSKLEIPDTTQQVISKIERAQLFRSRQDMSMQLGEIMQSVQRTLNRYTVDVTLHPGKKIAYAEYKRRRMNLLEKIAAYANSAEIKENILVHILAWLEEWNGILSETTAVDTDDHYHWLAQMEILPETFKAIESDVKILIRISTSLLEVKKRQTKKLTSRGALWKSWKERVIKRPATAHALRPDQMISDDFARNIKVSEIQGMLQELIGTAMFNKLENSAIKYISSTIANLSKALSALNDEVKLINFQSASVYINETNEREKELSQKIIQDLSEKNVMLQQKLQDAEEKCDQLIRSKVSSVSPTSTLKILSELSPQSPMAISKADKEDSIDSILAKQFENIVDEAHRKGTRASGIKWDSAMSYTAQVEMTPDLIGQQSPLPEKKQKTPKNITEDTVLLKKDGVYQKDGADEYQSPKRKHTKRTSLQGTSLSHLSEDKGKKMVSEPKVDYQFELQALEKKSKEMKSFSEAKSRSSLESKDQRVPTDFPSTHIESPGGKSGTSSLWERVRKLKTEYLLGKSQVSSENKEEPTPESIDESESEISTTEPFRLTERDHPSEILKTKGKKYQISLETTKSKEEKTGEKDTSVITKKFKSHELVKSQPRITEETSESIRGLGSSHGKSEQNNLEEFQKAIMAFLKEKTDHIEKPLDEKTVPEKELLLQKAEAEKLEIIKAKIEEYFQSVAETVIKIWRKYKDIKYAGQVKEKPMKQKKVVSYMPGLHVQKPTSENSKISTLLSDESMDPVVHSLIEMIVTEIESERDAPVVSIAGIHHKEKEKQRQKEYLQEGQENNFDINLKDQLEEERNLWEKSYNMIKKNLKKEKAWFQMEEGEKKQQKNRWQEEEVREEQQKQRIEKQSEKDVQQKQMEDEEEERQKQKQQQLEAWEQTVKTQGVPLEKKGQQMRQVQKEVKHLQLESSWERQEKQKPRRKVEDHKRQWQKKGRDPIKMEEENSEALKELFSHTSVPLSPRRKKRSKDAFQLYKPQESHGSLQTLESLVEEEHPIPVTLPTPAQAPSPGPYPISGWSPTKSIAVTAEQAQALGITVTPEQVQAQGIILTPQQAQALGVTITPEQAQALGVTITPEQAQALGVTVTPEQAQALGVTVTPQQAQALGVTVTPQQAQALGVTVTPQQAQALGVTVTPQQAQALGVTVTPQQAQALGVTVTPQQAQALGVTVTPQQAQALGVTVTPQQAQAFGVTVTPQQAQAQGITLTAEQFKALVVSLTPEKSQRLGLILTHEQVQALRSPLSLEQDWTLRGPITPSQDQTLKASVTSEQTWATQIPVTTKQAQKSGVPITPGQDEALGVTPQQTQALQDLLPEQAQALELTCTPEKVQTLGITCIPEQTQAVGTTLTPEQEQALGVPLTLDQAQALETSLTEKQAWKLGVSITPEIVQEVSNVLTLKQNQALGVPIAPPKAWMSAVTLTPEQTQALGAPLTSAHFLGSPITPEQVQPLGAPFTPGQAQPMGITRMSEQDLKSRVLPTNEQLSPLRADPSSGHTLDVGISSIADKSIKPRVPHITKQSLIFTPSTLRPSQESKASLPPGKPMTSRTRRPLALSVRTAEKSSIEVSSTPLQISRSPLTQALFVPGKSLGIGTPSDPRKLPAPQTFPSSRQTLVSKSQSTSVQLLAPEVPPTLPGKLPISGAPPTPGQPLAMDFLHSSRQFLTSRDSLPPQSCLIAKDPLAPRQLLIAGVPPTTSQISTVCDPLSPGKPFIPGASSIHGELMESGPLIPSEQPQAFQPSAAHEQSPYLQALSSLGQHLAPWTLPGQASPLQISFTPGHPPTLWAPSTPAQPQKDLSSAVSKKSKKRLETISSLKLQSTLVHPSAPSFKVPQAPFTTKKFQISEVSDTPEETQILSDPFAVEQFRTFQSYLANYRTPVSQLPYIDAGTLPTLMKPMTLPPALITQLPQTSQTAPSLWDQKSRFPPINKPCILTSVSGTKKPTIMVPSPSSSQEFKEQRYFVDVVAQRKNLILLHQATETSGLPSELHATARDLIIETLHTNTVRLGYLFRKYIAYRLIQRARNNIIKRLQAIQNSGKGYEMQNLYIMLSRIDDYQKNVMAVWTKKQMSLEQKRNQCLRKMMFLFSQLQEIHKLNLSQPIPLIINEKQIPAPTRFVQQPLLELLEKDRRSDILKKFRYVIEKTDTIWNADQSTSSYPITEKTSINSLWAQLGGYPAIPMLLQLDVQSTFRKSLASIQSQ
ncbi:protein FAM186A [Rhinolophus sinicus]|uniref:protein FAM186A n=1 Tax=Rhinolophus sinicus TaxID=89399 RepID=UPI003D7AA8A9